MWRAAAASDRPQAAKAEAAPAQQKAEEPRLEPDTAIKQHSEQGPGATDAGEEKWIYLDPTGTEQVIIHITMVLRGIP